MGEGVDFETHDAVGRNDVRTLLESPLGPLRGNVHYHIWTVVSGRVRREDGLPVFMFGATVDVKDRVSLSHLWVGSDFVEVRFLYKNKISRRFHRGCYR